ncbi:hypothetical protein [Marinobacter salarius]|jgi:hypothetical protein|uniref:hypothetical protein n=1 Tax=Marinobacter salarius TaxID=1420917 RepID=UPI0010AAEB18|nr:MULTISPECIES: hypothetical protein [Marinobacter]MBJ7302497.1 hypothetical protein [Marinobacter salarius]HIO30752.1 hypothetical protein [Marinobacter salarius]HIP01749.1 hypothetical protein [Marinobacter salarius]
MNTTLPNNLAVDRKKAKHFFVESGKFFSCRELRAADSENEIRRDIERDEPWRLPVTIVEVE